ncbi:fibroblast growth factor 11 isoform X2 [Mesocricetus auratus]|uniref:Fibroblast growth factor 11 isoform X2 n=1 Tax=Mesocricetus auratus TaxID=10036 RepID=A0ABM2XRT7_MESAU|nr:fibroblast growth factor 11 isoform X2 [Mesocricetus auratus]
MRSGGTRGVLDAWVTPRVSAALVAPPPLRFSRSSTIWLCSSWSSSPGQEPISPALPRVSLQLPRQPGPSVRPPSVTCASRRVLSTLSHYSCAIRKSDPTGSGDPLPVGTHTQFVLRNCTETWGVVPLTRGNKKIGRAGKERCKGWYVIPVQVRQLGSPSGLFPGRYGSPGCSSLRPPPPPPTSLSSKASSPNCSAARVSTSRQIRMGASRAPQRTPAPSPTSI